MPLDFRRVMNQIRKSHNLIVEGVCTPLPALRPHSVAHLFPWMTCTDHADFLMLSLSRAACHTNRPRCRLQLGVRHLQIVRISEFVGSKLTDRETSRLSRKILRNEGISVRLQHELTRLF